MPERRKVKMEVLITYACNLRCTWCNRFIDKFPWPDSHMKVEDVLEGAKRLDDHYLQVEKIKITGGEPLVHPKFKEIHEALRDTWKPERGISVHTNAITPHPIDFDAGVRGDRRLQESPVEEKDHHPWMVSPLDLGMQPACGIPTAEKTNRCSTQIRCGYGFDAFGFSACAQAGPMSRLLGMDVHSADPVLGGTHELCKHCIKSQPKNTHMKIVNKAKSGEIEHPTPTFKKALKDAKEKGLFHLSRFADRVKGKEKPPERKPITPGSLYTLKVFKENREADFSCA